MDTVGPVPTVVALPKHVKFWVHLKMQQLGAKLKLRNNFFDGCCFGLRSVQPGRGDFYLQKPWNFRTNIPELANALAGKTPPRGVIGLFGVSRPHFCLWSCGGCFCQLGARLVCPRVGWGPSVRAYGKNITTRTV